MPLSSPSRPPPGPTPRRRRRHRARPPPRTRRRRVACARGSNDSPGGRARHLARPRRRRARDRGRRCAGHGSYASDEPTAQLLLLVVDPSARRNGTGSALIDTFETWAAEQGARRDSAPSARPRRTPRTASTSARFTRGGCAVHEAPVARSPRSLARADAGADRRRTHRGGVHRTQQRTSHPAAAGCDVCHRVRPRVVTLRTRRCGSVERAADDVRGLERRSLRRTRGRGCRRRSAATDSGRPSRCGERFMHTNGQAPWFSGSSSCAHTTRRPGSRRAPRAGGRGGVARAARAGRGDVRRPALLRPRRAGVVHLAGVQHDPATADRSATRSSSRTPGRNRT